MGKETLERGAIVHVGKESLQKRGNNRFLKKSEDFERKGGMRFLELRSWSLEKGKRLFKKVIMRRGEEAEAGRKTH